MEMSNSLPQYDLGQWLHPVLHRGLNYLTACWLQLMRLVKIYRYYSDEDSTTW